MPARSKKSQSKHDTEVRRIANELKKQGYKVEADLKNFKKPETVDGYRPDVIATKANQKKIIEVETTESVGSARDKKQQQAFRNAANRSKNTTFRRSVVKTKDT